MGTNETVAPFGAKDWDDVRRVIRSNIQRKWGRMPNDDVEDALSEAIVDLYGYWLDLPSSLDTANPARNFAYACKRGTWTATNYLVKEFHHHEVNQPLDSDDEAPRRTHLQGGLPHDLPDPDADPLNILVERETIGEVSAAVADLSEEAVDRWFDAFITGKTTREAAAEGGVSPMTVSRRRNEGITELRKEVAA